MKTWVATLIVVAVIILSMLLTRAIVNSDLPMWLKFWLLK